QGILFNIKGSSDLSLFEVHEAAEMIRSNAHPEANIIFGAVIDEEMQDELHITVIATGFDKPRTADQGMKFSSASRISPPPVSPAPPRKEQAPAEKPVDFPVRSFNRDELDIPAFLRRSRDNNGR
ncbi:cell division protein FtsZ, partial [Arthrospira platensis SPKY2]